MFIIIIITIRHFLSTSEGAMHSAHEKQPSSSVRRTGPLWPWSNWVICFILILAFLWLASAWRGNDSSFTVERASPVTAAALSGDRPSYKNCREREKLYAERKNRVQQMCQAYRDTVRQKKDLGVSVCSNCYYLLDEAAWLEYRLSHVRVCLLYTSPSPRD